MPSNGIFEFYPSFKEFLPVYRDVTRIWMGDGETTGESGMLYAEYADGHVQELGWVSMYGLAVQEAGYRQERHVPLNRNQPYRRYIDLSDQEQCTKGDQRRRVDMLRFNNF